MARPCECDKTVVGKPFVRGRDCAKCWLWHNNPKSRAAWEGTTAQTAGAVGLPCVHRGNPLTGFERRDRQLDSRLWVWCLHPEIPLGPAVCGCKGCGTKCLGYKAKS